MNHTRHNQTVGFIWSIADDVLRDIYTRDKHRDIILSFTILKCLDTFNETELDNVDKLNYYRNKDHV